jgi:rubredoxin
MNEPAKEEQKEKQLVPEETPLPEKTPAKEKTLAEQAPSSYECRACGYVYVPSKGDSQGKVPAGTLFTELSPDWRCPVCGVRKTQFVNIGAQGAPSGFAENLDYGLGINRLTPSQKNILIFGALGIGFLFFLSLYGLH